jgi:alanyl-tRNA synthetase
MRRMKHVRDTTNHTTKLYWRNPSDTQFSAKVVEVWQDDDHIYAVFDSTLFYPEGGGQPSDRGTIKASGEITLYVDHVFEEDGRIVHLLSPDELSGGNLLEAGQTVHGQIDWARRFDFMQQHTGQHILSRAFEVVCNANTVGFHLGDDYVSIDLDIQSVSDSLLTEVEDLANRMIFSNLGVEIREYASNEVPDDIRRRIPADSHSVRVVYVGDFDACACGGTHVQATGEIGIIKINRLDRSHGGVRVIFRCGQRALADLRTKEKVLDSVARCLSAGYQDLPDTVAALSEKAAALEKEAGRLKRQLLEYEIQEIATQIASDDIEAAPGFDQERWVAKRPGLAVCKWEGRQAQELRQVARSLSELAGMTVIVFSQVPQFSLVVASHVSGGKRKGAAGVPPAQNAALLASELGQVWGIKGGGTPQLAQIGSKEPLDIPEQRILGDIETTMGKLGT